MRGISLPQLNDYGSRLAIWSVSLRIRAVYVVVVLVIFATVAAAAALLAGHPWMEPAQAVPDRHVQIVAPSSNTVAKRDRLEVRMPEFPEAMPASPVNLSFETALQYMAAPPSDVTRYPRRIASGMSTT